MTDFPSGVILLWHGAIVDIPVGWVLCDGNNGTPNLLDRFIPGAGGTYPVGGTGGSSWHSHPFTSSPHTHTIPAGTDIAAGVNFGDVTTNVPVTGTTDNGTSRPPYHALAYIMKT